MYCIDKAHEMHYNISAIEVRYMDTNMTFRMDSEVKAQMNSICEQLGMSASTAFNIFANAFIRANGFPFPVVIQEPDRKQNEKSYESN